MVYLEQFPPFPGAQLQEITAKYSFDPNGSDTITIPDRIEITFFFFFCFSIRSPIVIVCDPDGSKKYRR